MLSLENKFIRMVKILLFPILLFNFLSLNSSAQKIITDGTLKYNISIKSTGNSAVPKSFQGATYNLYLKGNLIRSDFNSGLGIESSIFDEKNGKGILLKEYSGQKLMINLTRDNWLSQNQVFQNLKFKIETDEKKINEIVCKKATAVLQNGEVLIVYFTPDLLLGNKYYNTAFPGVPGLPVQFTRKQGAFIFEYNLNSINYDVVSSVTFEYPKSGYRVLSYDEAQKLNKGE